MKDHLFCETSLLGTNTHILYRTRKVHIKRFYYVYLTPGSQSWFAVIPKIHVMITGGQDRDPVALYKRGTTGILF